MPKGVLQSLLTGERPIVSHVQPMYRLRDNRKVAQEYLVRYLDSSGSPQPVGPILQSPDLDPADRLTLDLRFLEQTFGILAAGDGAEHLHFVNLEPVSLEACGFWEALPRWLEGLPFAPGQVVLEFTEGQRIHDAEALRRYAARLRDAGVRIAVDDLGAGVASLSHMARLAPDF
ncbi:MAG TPA: EAL domain-containing protein, partial [Holophagaceae bacterium]